MSRCAAHSCARKRLLELYTRVLSKLREPYTRVLSLPPGVFGFFGGGLVSAALSLYASIVSMTSRIEDGFPLGLSAGMLLVSGLSCAALSWRLDDLHRAVYLEAPPDIGKDELDRTWEAAVAADWLWLLVLLVLAVGAVGAALGVSLPRFLANLAGGDC